MRKWILIALLGLMTGLPVMAEDVVYITTEQFRERVFDYKKEKDK